MCAKVYRSGAGLRYHKRKRHRGKFIVDQRVTEGEDLKRVTTGYRSSLQAHRNLFLYVFLCVGEGMVEPTALHRVKCQEFGCTYQMLAISDLR